jgi:hypothetical protein
MAKNEVDLTRVPRALLNAAEAAHYLGVSVDTLKLWRKRGEGPRIRRFAQNKGAWARYSIRDLDEFIATLPAEPPVEEPKRRSRKGGAR